MILLCLRRSTFLYRKENLRNHDLTLLSPFYDSTSPFGLFSTPRFVSCQRRPDGRPQTGARLSPSGRDQEEAFTIFLNLTDKVSVHGESVTNSGDKLLKHIRESWGHLWVQPLSERDQIFKQPSHCVNILKEEKPLEIKEPVCS